MIDEKFIQKQERKIERDIARLKSEIEKDKKYLEIGTTNEDNAMEFEVFEEKRAYARNAEKELEDLERALKKIKKGKYGICEKCGEPIEKGRLKAYPAATHCVTHAKSE